jgi:ribosomal 50S subunit-recycling heat shock protein
MRLDLFLKASRLSPRRTVAQQLCDAGLVLVNRRAAKSSHSVKVGDLISIRRGNSEKTIKVVSLPETRQTGRKEATSLYDLISETSVEAL